MYIFSCVRVPASVCLCAHLVKSLHVRINVYVLECLAVCVRMPVFLCMNVCVFCVVLCICVFVCMYMWVGVCVGLCVFMCAHIDMPVNIPYTQHGHLISISFCNDKSFLHHANE